jgi:Zn-dependent peptidase ImmA (M78 family)
MVRFVRDTMHGFSERPHYEARELDSIFEKIVCDFLRKKYGKVEFPIDTEDLKTIIEADVRDLDQFADLSKYGPSVEGVTEFSRDSKPKVLISTFAHKHENRLRTTLTHEYGHVHLHGYMFALERTQTMQLGPNQKPDAIYCKRDTIVSARKVDWREWQAGYASGAMLMPKSHLMRVAGDIQKRQAIYGPVAANTPNGQCLIDAIVGGFTVSRDAARVRLSVLGLIGEPQGTASLFD